MLSTFGVKSGSVRDAGDSTLAFLKKNALKAGLTSARCTQTPTMLKPFMRVAESDIAPILSLGLVRWRLRIGHRTNVESVTLKASEPITTTINGDDWLLILSMPKSVGKTPASEWV